MEIAKEFDEKEKQVMMEMGVETNDFLKFMAVCKYKNIL